MMEGRILGTPPDRPSIILQSGAFVNIQNAQMMGQKFFLSNNTVWGDAVMGLDVDTYKELSPQVPYQQKSPWTSHELFCWHGVRDSEPTPRLWRAGQAALRSRWSLQNSVFFVILRFERVFSSQTPYQQRNRGIKPRFLCWHGVRDSEPTPRLWRAGQAALRSRWSLQSRCFFSCLRLERRSHPQRHINRKTEA